MNHPTSPDPPDRPTPESESVQPIIFEFSDETSKSQETIVPGALTGPPIPRAGLSPAPPPPAAFGRYAVRKRLGEGAFGAVYLGHDTQLDRPVAIKVFRGGNGPAAEAERLLREARRLARLRHPGIVTVHDVGTQDGQVFIVSDYLDGQDLGSVAEAAFADLATERGHRRRRGRCARSRTRPTHHSSRRETGQHSHDLGRQSRAG